MIKRPKAHELIELSPKEANFVIEYCKDYAPRRAAEASGFVPETGASLLKKPTILAAIEMVQSKRLDASHIDAEWVLMEAADNHQIARQQGNISASNTALTLIAKHTMVDAMASDKLNMNVHADAEIMERLQRGRQRNADRDS